jgi:hypothetical protein
MTDTPPDIENRQIEMMMAMTANERIAAACEMFMAARQLILESMPDNISKDEALSRCYEVLYSQTLPPDFFEV